MNNTLVTEVVYPKQSFFRNELYCYEESAFYKVDNIPLDEASLRWGIESLEIDEEALLKGQFRLKRCYIIYEQGYVIDVDEDKNVSLVYELKNGVIRDDVIDIFLAFSIDEKIKNVRKDKRNYAQALVGHQQMFRMQQKQKCKVNGTTLKLTSHVESQKGLCSFKIAELVKTNHEGYQLVCNFIPSMTRIGNSSFLINLMDYHIKVMAEKIEALKKYHQKLRQNPFSFDHNSLHRFLLLYSMNRALAQLKNLRNDLSCHPYQLFLVLTDIIGILQTFNFNQKSSLVFPYQHHNLTRIFVSMDDLLKRLHNGGNLI